MKGRRIPAPGTILLGAVLTGAVIAPATACQCFNFSRAEIVQRADIVFETTSSYPPIRTRATPR